MRLTSQQQAIIDGLKKKREVYDRQATELEASYKAEKRLLKQPLLEASKEADEAGISTRQIHLALGFGQVVQMVGFFKEVQERPSEQIKELFGRVEKPKVTNQSVDITVDGKWVHILDVDGTHYLGGFSGSFPVAAFYFYDLPNRSREDVPETVLNAIREWARDENVPFNFEQRS